MSGFNSPDLREAGAEEHWEALHEAASAVALLAGRDPGQDDELLRSFPLRTRELNGWRKDLIESGVADLSAILQPGLAALLSVQSRGQSAAAPAEALWQEFYAGREALLRILPED